MSSLDLNLIVIYYNVLDLETLNNPETKLL